MSNYYLTLGQHDVSLNDPKVDQIDLMAVEARLRKVHRFSGDPSALTIFEHEVLVANLVKLDRQGLLAPSLSHAATLYAMIHDHPEAITGDIPGPLKKYLLQCGDAALAGLEMRLESVMLEAYGVKINDTIRQAVAYYDKVAESLEWRYQLMRPWFEWCHPDAIAFDPTEARNLILQVQMR